MALEPTTAIAQPCDAKNHRYVRLSASLIRPRIVTAELENQLAAFGGNTI